MSRYYSYINSAKEIIGAYKGEEPFTSFLKRFFSGQKKYGSTDRKHVSHLCYCYFRLGGLAIDLPVETRLLLGLFLVSTSGNDVLQNLKPEWNRVVGVSLREKYSIAGLDCPGDVFPFLSNLSKGLDEEHFSLSHLSQPYLFLRIRPGKEGAVTGKIAKGGIPFELPFPDIVSLPNGTKVEGLIHLNRDAVVQDYNSQMALRVVEFAAPAYNAAVWDCCAASGGKSIQLIDMYPGIELTVSDIRVSIVANLHKRFAEAGIKRYRSLVADVTSTGLAIQDDFDLILADVPCSGSGTWSRTPEQLSFFDVGRIQHYSILQRKIVSNVWSHLRIGGHLLYITCSVFAEENENNIRFFTANMPGLEVVKMELLKGYDKKADTLFAALLKKTS